MTEINHAEVAATLHRAADLIEERGWAVGEGWDPGPTDPLCTEGAIQAALGLSSFTEAWGCPAHVAVREYLGVHFIHHWNDDLMHDKVNVAIESGESLGRPLNEVRAEKHAEAAAEVVEVLRAAAAIEQAKADVDLTKPTPPVLHSHADGTWTVTYDPTVWAPEFIEALVLSSAADRVRGAVES